MRIGSMPLARVCIRTVNLNVESVYIQQYWGGSSSDMWLVIARTCRCKIRASAYMMDENCK